MRRVPRWLTISTAVTAAALLSILFVDKPLALACARLGLYPAALDNGTVKLPVMAAAACLAVLLAAISIGSRKTLPHWLRAAMLAGLALLWSYSLIDFVLKPIFGRAPPGVLLWEGRYGFWPLHYGEEYGSFPSGHSDQAAAILAVLWSQYPAWRWLWVLAFVLLAAALVVGEWHYLGDIIAGGAIGAAAGTWTVLLWDVVRQQRGELS